MCHNPEEEPEDIIQEKHIDPWANYTPTSAQLDGENAPATSCFIEFDDKELCFKSINNVCLNTPPFSYFRC